MVVELGPESPGEISVPLEEGENWTVTKRPLARFIMDSVIKGGRRVPVVFFSKYHC